MGFSWKCSLDRVTFEGLRQRHRSTSDQEVGKQQIPLEDADSKVTTLVGHLAPKIVQWTSLAETHVETITLQSVYTPPVYIYPLVI